MATPTFRCSLALTNCSSNPANLELDDDLAGVRTLDEARRIAVKVAKLVETVGANADREERVPHADPRSRQEPKRASFVASPPAAP